MGKRVGFPETARLYLAANSVSGARGDVSKLIVNLNVEFDGLSVLHRDRTVIWRHMEGTWRT